MQKLNLPVYDFRTRVEGNKLYVLDIFRKCNVQFTQEEEVRQRFARYLVEEKGYPASLILTEHTLKLNNMVRCCDILVHRPARIPAALVECKSPSIKISRETFDQADRYNMVFRVRYLIITNGLKHYCCYIDLEQRKIRYLDAIPAFDELV
ncbi:MAG: type I restriction enzyme HsdR N-terminal domain-containing protein [Bacteroidales bacterium]|nr:type I restriction enzyme HsdR N-terminal domain-containing protein [Bacteroidales bacterium]